MVDGPKFDRHNSEKAVDAVAQVKLSWDTDYKHNKWPTVQNIKVLTTQQVKNITRDVVNFDNDSFERQMKELGISRVNVKKMFDGSTEMIPLFKNLFNEERYLEGFK